MGLLDLLKPKKKTGADGESPAKAEGTTELQDLLAPPALEVNTNYLKLGERMSRTLFAFSYPRFLTANWFNPIINMDRDMDIAIFAHPIDSELALKNLRKKATQVEAQIAERQEKGMIRDPMLQTALQDIEALRDRLLQAQERVFSVGLYITFYGDSLEELNKHESEISRLLQSRLVYVKPTVFQQKEGFTTTAPLGRDDLQILTPMNSGPASTLFPFVSADLSADRGILYGINRHNNSLVLFDRFKLENANMVIFAKSGAGKSYAAKLEILRSLMFGVDVIVIDPEREYQYLAETVGGTFIPITLTSPYHLNPLDLPKVHEGEEPSEVLRSNILVIIGLLRLMLGQLSTEEEAILDRALLETYAAYDITPETDFSGKTPPRLEDLEHVLSSLEGGESLAKRISRFTSGTYGGFLNQHTNADLSKRLVVFSIRDLEDELRPIAMYLILHFIWNSVRKELKKRILLIDEAWWMMQNKEGASFLFGIAKRARKYYLGVTTVTQDVEDFMTSAFGQPIVKNSSLQFLMKQSPANIDVLVKTFNLTEFEKLTLLESNVGEGILFAGLKHAAIRVVASYSEDQVITTNPEQLLQIEKAKEELERAAAKVI